MEFSALLSSKVVLYHTQEIYISSVRIGIKLCPTILTKYFKGKNSYQTRGLTLAGISNSLTDIRELHISSSRHS